MRKEKLIVYKMTATIKSNINWSLQSAMKIVEQEKDDW